jgi:hypothetical protein
VSADAVLLGQLDLAQVLPRSEVGLQDSPLELVLESLGGRNRSQ